ncbi:MAG: type II secretion system F family protein [Longimicrobiales bacterium]|nr:type II secretion system F family protein [Longimicrobiales bacterium]
MNLSPFVTAMLVFTAVVFATFALVLGLEALRDWLRRRAVARRLEPVLNQLDEGRPGRSGDLIRQFQDDDTVLGTLMRGMPGVLRTENLLREARSEWRPETLLLLSTGLAFGTGIAVLLLTGMLVLAALGAAGGAWLPYLHLRRKAARRLRRFEEEFPETIELLTRAIRAGHPLASGMRMVADEGPAVVAEEFRQTFEEQRFGLPFNDALLGMVDRVNLVDVRIFAIAILIQREVGGNLAEILDNLATTIRERFYIRRQLRVYTAQGRMSGYALAALPLVVGGITFLMQPEYIGLLFSTAIGQALVVTAVLLQIIGVFWIRNIINIDI